MTSKATTAHEQKALEAPWETATKRDLPGGGRHAMVELANLLRWIALTEKLGCQEASSDMLRILETHEHVPLYLAWDFRAVDVVDQQAFGLDVATSMSDIEEILGPSEDLEAIRKSGKFPSGYRSIKKPLPEGVSLGRSAALFCFRRSVRDVFTTEQLDREQIEAKEAGASWGGAPGHNEWVFMAIRGEDAHALWSTSEPFQAVKTYPDLMAHTKERRASGNKIAWAANPHLGKLVLTRKARLEADGKKGADDLIASELGVTAQMIRIVLKQTRALRIE